jgi:hypothetical protein
MPGRVGGLKSGRDFGQKSSKDGDSQLCTRSHYSKSGSFHTNKLQLPMQNYNIYLYSIKRRMSLSVQI